MLNLSNLRPQTGSKKRKKRVGRGTSSGLGKTCGRGHKGQTSRSGGTKGSRFEGGQTPLYRRLPKRGFKNHPFRVVYQVFNLFELDKAKKATGLIKILGSGEVTGPVEVKAHKVSATARKKIEAAGGKIINA
ncbi:MAG: 50S ribosomal protein L15 [Candidatus Margulisbacteria bacterium]|nr:50S ribosomal protein L15 [Candidatus Margulisiibacteriota bacterium]MBU1616550.1 50S ribosomal protein L15 [Candidatus Margulisiibacteriota bacterium]